MSAKSTISKGYFGLKAAAENIGAKHLKNQPSKKFDWRGLRLGLFTSLLVLAPFSKYPYIALPAFDFTSFRLGFYQLLAAAFVLSCAWPLLNNLKSLYKQNKLVFASLITLALITVIGLFNAIYKARSLLSAASILFLLVLVAAAWWFVSTEFNKSYIKPIINCLLVAGIFFSVAGILQFIFATLSGEGLSILCKNCSSTIFGFTRINGFAAEPQFYANSLLPVLFISLGYSYVKRNKLAVTALSLSSLAIALTFSRGAYLAVAGGTIVYLILVWFSKIFDYKQLGQVILLVLLCFIAGFSLLITSATYRYRTTPNISYNTFASMVDHLTLGVIDIKQKSDTKPSNASNNPSNFTPSGLIKSSTQDRLGAADLALKAWRSKTYTVAIGVGAGNLGPYVIKHIDSSVPDNLTVYIYYVLIMSELGLIGLLAFATIYLSGLLSFIRRYFKDKNSALYMAAIGLMAAFLIQYLFFGTYINTVYIWLWAGIILGLAGLKHLKPEK
jgi:hypothetical protein